MNSSDELFHPVKTVRASEAIYEQIKERIVSGELRPGDRLPSERAIMELFQRSRPTIREALRMLERSGYIRTTAGSNGAVVTLPDSRNMAESIGDALQIGQITLREVSEYRMISEGAAAAWAAERATDEDLAELRACLAKMAVSTGSYAEFAPLDAEFHLLIARAAKNRVSELMNSTLNNINRSFAERKTQEIGEQAMCRRIYKMHVKIFDAIAGRDSERARQEMERHMASFFADLK